MVLLFVYFSGLLVSCLLCFHISSSKDEGLHKIGELLHLTLQLTLICTVANLLVPLLCNLDQDHQSSPATIPSGPRLFNNIYSSIINNNIANQITLEFNYFWSSIVLKTYFIGTGDKNIIKTYLP